ncbi:MAG: hypothetical protein RIS64_4158, partial [Bacteroidota bacterium]
MIFGERKIKRLQTKGNFNEAWNITASWEGPWEAETSESDAGNYFNNLFYGTNYGITAEFAKNFGGISLDNTDVIKKLDQETDCKRMWQKIWDKMIFGDS